MESVLKFCTFLHTPLSKLPWASSPMNGHPGFLYSALLLSRPILTDFKTWFPKRKIIFKGLIVFSLPHWEIQMLMRKIVATIESSAKGVSDVNSRVMDFWQMDLKLHLCYTVPNYLTLSYSLPPHGVQLARLPCPSPSPGTCSNSCPLSWWHHPTISSSVVPFSSCLQSFPA